MYSTICNRLYVLAIIIVSATITAVLLAMAVHVLPTGFSPRRLFAMICGGTLTQLPAARFLSERAAIMGDDNKSSRKMTLELALLKVQGMIKM